MSVAYVVGYFFMHKNGNIAVDITEAKLENGKVTTLIGGFEQLGYTIEIGQTYQEAVNKRNEILNVPVAVPSFEIIQPISTYNQISRIAKVTKICTIDYQNNVLPIELSIIHSEQKELDKTFLLIANNSKLINGIGDFDYILDLHENKGFKISEIARQIIQLRDMDGTINAKMNYI